MAFGIVSKLLSILSSIIVYIAVAIIFSENEEMLIAFVLAALIITVIIFLTRLLFIKGEHRLRFAMKSMHPRGFMKRRMVRSYKHTHERKVISGAIARILAFGLIYYLFIPQLIIVYISIGFALICAIFMLMSFKHKFIDIISGTIIGLSAGFLSSEFAPILMTKLGF